MSESTLILFTLSRAVFFISNILLDYSFLTPKRPLWFQIIAFGGTWLTTYLLRDLLNTIVTDPFLAGYLLSLLFLLPFALVFKESLHAKIFVFFMVTSLSQFIFLIFLFLELLMFKHMVGGLILIGLLLELSSIPLIRRYVTPHVRTIMEVINHQNPIFTLFPILSFVLLAFYGVQRIYLLPTFMPLVLSTILIIFTYYLIAISINRTRRHQELEKQLALQRDHYLNLNNSITLAKENRHDLRHHMVTLSEFLGNNDTIAAQNYVHRLCHSYDDSAIPSVCRNQSADALICHYLKLAKQQDIAFSTQLHLPDDLGIDDLDLCVVIGNCLENAIEACSKINRNQPRSISISATITKGHLIIIIANSFNHLIQNQDDNFLSSKIGPDHGIGLGSVKTLTAKYKGHCSISLEQNIFKVSVSMKLPDIVVSPMSLRSSG